jgi:chitinase
MRRLAAVLALAATALAGCTGAVAGTPAAAPAPVAPVRVTAYVDVSVPHPDLAAVAKQTGLRHVTLAFALAGKGGCEPAWGGTRSAGAFAAEIAAFRAAGGDVSVATGGAQGRYLENACATAADLAGAYGKLLDATGSTHLDVDVETGVRADVVVDALARVQSERGTAITLTLPIDLAGLAPAGLDLVTKAAAAKVAVTVNGMDMNFRTGGDWGQAMVDAGQAVLDQLRRVHPDASEAAQNAGLSLTIMIGRNDTAAVTKQADATKVLGFARSRGLGRLGLWSLGRDNGRCPGTRKAQPTCSGIAQKDREFTAILASFQT